MKLVHGVVFALPEDSEYADMAHLWTRDIATGYSMSLSRAGDADAIEVRVADQHRYVGDIMGMTLSAVGLRIQIGASAANALDGHLEYEIEFHSGSDSIDTIARTLKVLMRGKSGLVLPLPSTS